MPRGGTRAGAGRKPKTFANAIVNVRIPGTPDVSLIVSRRVIETLLLRPDPAAAMTDALAKAFDRRTRRRCTNTRANGRCGVYTARRNAEDKPLCKHCSQMQEIYGRVL